MATATTYKEKPPIWKIDAYIDQMSAKRIEAGLRIQVSQTPAGLSRILGIKLEKGGAHPLERPYRGHVLVAIRREVVRRKGKNRDPSGQVSL